MCLSLSPILQPKPPSSNTAEGLSANTVIYIYTAPIPKATSSFLPAGPNLPSHKSPPAALGAKGLINSFPARHWRFAPACSSPHLHFPFPTPLRLKKKNHLVPLLDINTLKDPIYRTRSSGCSPHLGNRCPHLYS